MFTKENGDLKHAFVLDTGKYDAVKILMHFFNLDVEYATELLQNEADERGSSTYDLDRVVSHFNNGPDILKKARESIIEAKRNGNRHDCFSDEE